MSTILILSFVLAAPIGFCIGAVLTYLVYKFIYNPWN